MVGGAPVAAAGLTRAIQRELDINRVVRRQRSKLGLFFGADDVIRWADQALELGRRSGEAQAAEWQYSGHTLFSATILSRFARVAKMSSRLRAFRSNE